METDAIEAGAEEAMLVEDAEEPTAEVRREMVEQLGLEPWQRQLHPDRSMQPFLR